MARSNSAGLGPRLIGSTTLTGTAAGDGEPTPWRLSGAIAADFSRATIKGAEFSLGQEERAVRAEGDATLVYGSPARLSLTMKSKQANLDSLLRQKDEAGAGPGRALAFFARALAPALGGVQTQVAIDADVSAESIILGAQTISGASASLRSTPGEPLHARFDLSLPSLSQLQGTGDLETGAAPRFRGDIDFRSGDFGALRDWASRGASDPATKMTALANALDFRNVSLAGGVEASAGGFAGRNLKIALDRSTLAGSVAFASAPGAGPAKLDADLASDSLDVDALPAIGAGARMMSDLDLSIALKAGALHISRLGEAEINAGSMSLKLTKTGSDITLDHLSLAGLDGASVDLQGGIAHDSISANGRLRAERLRDFALLLTRLAPDDWTRVLVERAEALSPASLTFEARGDTGAAGGGPALVSLKANGSAGATQFAVTADRRAADVRALTATFDSTDSGELLRQFGFERAAAGNGHAHVSINASGAWEQGYDVDAASQIAGADFTWRGRLLPTATGDDAQLFGAVKVKTQNLAPLLTALGLSPPGGGAPGSADIAFDATERGDHWTFSRIAATIGRAKASGALTFAPAAPLPTVTQAQTEISRIEDALDGGAGDGALQQPRSAQIEGDLAIDRLALGNLLALTLGPPAPAKAGARWPDAKFAPVSFTPPPTAIRLKVATLDLADGLPAQAFAVTLHLDKRRLELDDITTQVAGGSATGRAILRRDGETATLSGKLALDSAAIDRAGFSGRVSATLDFASTGRNPAALVGGLAGAGTATFAGAALTRSDPDALDRLVAKVQNPDAQVDETNIAFGLANELGKAPLPIPDGSVPIALSAGVMKVGPVTIARPRASASIIAYLDLSRLAVDTRLSIASPADGLKFWSGPPPAATIDVQNAFDAPKRQLDVSSLSAALAAQAIARETDRIATMEADIRERAFFNRRLKGERFMDQREDEIEDWRAEQERLRGLSQRLRKQEEEKAAAEKAAAEKAAAEKAAAEKAAGESG